MTDQEMLDKLTNQYGVRIGAIINDPAGVHAKITAINEDGFSFWTTNLPDKQVNGFIPVECAYEGFSKGRNSVIGYTEDVAKPAKEEMSFQDKYPHVCQYCGARCWNGGITYDCSNPVCPTKNK